MENKPPTPVMQTFLICREIFQDKWSHHYILVGPSLEFVSQTFPGVTATALYVQVSSCHGRYRPELQLQDFNGQVVWSEALDPPFDAPDPLRTYTLTFQARLPIPRPGGYDVVLLLNGREVGRRAFKARVPTPPVGGTS